MTAGAHTNQQKKIQTNKDKANQKVIINKNDKQSRNNDSKLDRKIGQPTMTAGLNTTTSTINKVKVNQNLKMNDAQNKQSRNNTTLNLIKILANQQ
jgi:hypothetical protein